MNTGLLQRLGKVILCYKQDRPEQTGLPLDPNLRTLNTIQVFSPLENTEGHLMPT